MKKRLLALFLALLMCIGVLLMSACSQKSDSDESDKKKNEEKNDESKKNEESKETEDSKDSEETEEIDPYALEESIPYQLTYTSNNDGTCSVNGIIINSNYHELFDLVIPEQSPDGDTVTAIAWGNVFDSYALLLPRYIVSEDFFEPLKEAYPKWDQENTEDEYRYKKIRAFFDDIDPNGQYVSNGHREYMLQTYAILQYVPRFYISIDDLKLSQIFWCVQMIDQHDLQTSYEEQEYINQLLKSKGLTEEEIAEVYPDFDRVPKYLHTTKCVNSIVLPSTLTSIEADCFVNVRAAEPLNVPDNYTSAMIDELMKSDLDFSYQEEF